MSENETNLLIKKFKEKKLSHFYILESNTGIFNDSDFLETFIENFLEKVLTISIPNKKNYTSLIKNRTHPDILFIGDQLETIHYKTEDFAPIFEFNELSNQELPYKFIIIKHAHAITNTIFNKLLKILEEPNKKTTIFLLNSKGTKLLATIQSRGVRIRPITTNEISQKHNNINKIIDNYKIKKISIIEAVDSLKSIDSTPPVDQVVLNIVLSSFLTTPSDYQKYNKTLELTRWVNESQTFNNSISERLFEVLELL